MTSNASQSDSPGVFTLSLDFELYWGMRDKQSLAALAPALRGARVAIPKMLQRFAAREVHATWATVGLLFFDDADALKAAVPAVRPRYLDRSLSPFDDVDALNGDEARCDHALAGSLIERIRETPGQEIATHTFSHYYCLEAGADLDDFEADVVAARAAAAARGCEIRTIVFPRNQYSDGHVAVAMRNGIDVYRGNPESWMYRPRPDGEQTAIIRGARLLDAYLPISGMQTWPLEALRRSAPINIPASRFLRPVDRRLARLERLRLLRVRTEMSYAAQHGHLYHLWWHPHNFGLDIDGSMAMLDTILDHFVALRERHGMRSLTMGELGGELIEPPRASGR